MRTSIVGTRYAKALVDVVLAPGSSLKPADALGQLNTVSDLLASSSDLKSVLLTPAVATSRKKAVLTQLSEAAGVSQTIRNFLCVLLDHKRIGELPGIHAAFELLLDEALGFVRADVTSAAPLSAAESKTIEAELTHLSGKQVRMHTAVDKDLLGGVVARIGSTVYDGSVRGQLEGMRRKLVSEAT